MEPINDYYEYLKKAGADVAPNIDSFKSTLSDVNTAKQYYGYLRQAKFDTPDTFESFSSTLGLGKKKDGSTVSPVSPSPFVSESPSQKSARHTQTFQSDAQSLESNYKSGLDQAFKQRDQFGGIDMFGVSQFQQSREGKAGKIVSDFQSNGTATKEDVKYLNAIAPKAAAQIVFSGTPEPVKQKIQKTGKVDDADIDSFTQNHKQIVGDNVLATTGKFYSDQNKKLVSTLTNIPGFEPSMVSDPKYLNNFYKSITASKTKELAALDAEFPEKVIPSGVASITVRENGKEYEARLKDIDARYAKTYDAFGRLAASKIATPDRDPLEIGLEYLKFADPIKYSVRVKAGSSGIDRDIAAVGSQLQYANTSDLRQLKNVKSVGDNLDTRFPEKLVAETRRRLGAELYKGDNWFLNFSPSVEELDKAAAQLPEKNKEAYFKYVREEESKIIGTNIPQSGALNQLGMGMMSTVEGTNNYLASKVGARGEKDIAKDALNAPNKTRFEAAGAGQVEMARIKELNNKLNSGSTLTVDELEEKRDLESFTNIRSTGQKVIDGSFNLAGQVLFQALGTKGLAGLGSAVVKGAGLLKTAMPVGLATEEAIASSAMNFGISQSQIANVAGAMVAYSSSYDGASQEAIQLFPDDNNKRTIYTTAVAGLNAVTERIFKDEKILDAFKRTVRPNIGNLVNEIASGRLTKELLQPTLTKIINDGFKIVGLSTIENVKETTEEVATSVGTSLTKLLLAPEKFNYSEAVDDAVTTATTMFTDGALVALVAGVKGYRENKVGIGVLSNLGINKTFTADVKSVLNAQILSGDITKEEAAKKINVINKIIETNTVDMPRVKALAKISETASKKYAIALSHEKLLKQEMDATTDEALKSKIQEDIKASESIRKSILNKEVFIDDNYAVVTPQEAANSAQELSNIDILSPEQIQITGDSTEFANQMESAQGSLGRVGMSVSPYAQDEYDSIAAKGGKFLRAAGNKILALLKPNGEMVSLVKDATVKTKGAAQAMISRMKDMGGLFMDNYDIYLTPIYEKAGYKVAARIPFNEEYAPEGWDAEDSPLKNKPDVVFMVRNDIAPEQAQTFTNYDEAQNFTKAIVENAVAQGIAKLPAQAGAIDTALGQAIPKATKSLEKAGIKFKVVDGATDRVGAMAARGNQALFLSDDGTIIIDRSKLQNDIEAGLVVWHEASHPVMNIIRNTNKALYDAVVRGINAAAKNNKGVADALNWAQSQEQYDNADTQNDEAIVETIGRINSGLIDVSKLDTGLRQQIIDFVNSIAKFFGINPILNDTDLAAFKKTVSDVADALKAGRDISVVVGEENVGRFDYRTGQARKDSSQVAKDTEDRTVDGLIQPSMVLKGKVNKQDVDLYSGPSSIEDLKIVKPTMYVSRAEDFAKSDLVQGKVKMYPSTASIEQKLKWADNVYKKAKETVVSNLLFVYDSIPDNIRDISKLWYDGANIIAQELATKYDTTLEQASAVIATQSPQKPWYDNVHLAHFIMDFYAKNKDMEMTQEMYEYYKLKAQPSKINPKGYPKQIEYLPVLNKAIGKKFSDLSTYDRSVMMRAEFDNKFERRAPLRIPTGVIVGRVTSMSSFSGYDTIAKGISILDDGSAQNISDNLGGAYKVRNFNNNIVKPREDGEVTIDTHAMAAAYLLPLGSSSPEVKFDEGTYAFFADAYRDAAKKRGVLAREMQSIVWEGVRSVFPASDKSDANKKIAREIWSNYKNGSLTLDSVQDQIKNNGKDLSITDWSKFSDRIFEEDGQPNYLEELPLAGRDRNTDGSRDGGIDSGRLPRMGRGDKQDGNSQASVGNRDIINGFYSPIEDRINTFKQPKASVQKWKEIVGVKSDEAVFSGLSDWLGGMKPDRQLSKEEVSKFIKDNRIEIKEVVKGKGAQMTQSQMDDVYNGTRDQLANMDMIDDVDGDRNNPLDVWYNNPTDENYDTLGEFTEERGIDLNFIADAENDGTKYSQYQLPGGENYKEVLITLPSEVLKLRKEFNQKYPNWGAKPFEEVFSKEDADRFQKAIGKKEFKSSHFEEGNIITHLRMNTRTDADGKKVLFLEEVQSDWGQKGKREGFATNSSELKQLSDIRDRMYKLSIEQESLFETKKVGNTGTITDFQQTIKNKSRYDQIEKELSSLRIEEQKINKGDVAPAPYVTNTNAWVKLGLKVALKEAVKQGVDRIAWTTGDQQNDRYDLAKSIKRIDFIRIGDNKYKFEALGLAGKRIAYDDNGTTSLQEIENMFGKDVAEKVKSDKRGDLRLEGEGLKVGGKGMKAFYGDANNTGIVGNVAKALVKELTGKDGTIVASKINDDSAQKNRAIETARSNDMLSNDQRQGLIANLESSPSTSSIQPAIDITPELAQSVQQGMPQFSVGNRSEDDLRAPGTGKERDRALSSRFGSLDPETQAKIEDDATTYFQKTNKQTSKAVEEFIDGQNLIDMADYVLSKPDIPEVSKVWMAAEVAKRMNAEIAAAKSAGDQQLVDALIDKQSAIYNDFAKQATSLGQAVQAFIAFKSDPNAVDFFLPNILKQLKKAGVENVTDVQKADIVNLLRDVNSAADGLPKDKAIIKLSHYLAGIAPMKPMDVLQALWYAKILSGITTQSTNFFANVFNTAFELPAVAARIAIMNMAPLSLAAGVKGFGSGIVKGAVAAADIMKTGVRSKEVDKYFAESPLEYFTWSKWLGKTGNAMDYIPPINFGAWKFIGRMLAATDALFSTANQEAIANMLAYAEAAGTPGNNNFKKANAILGNTKQNIDNAKAQATAEGFDPKSLQGKRRVIEIVAQGRKGTDEADAIGKRITMNYNPEGWTKPLFDATVALQRSFPIIKMVVPFARIVANLTENGLNYSPLGLVRAVTGKRNPIFDNSGDKLSTEERVDLFNKFAMGMTALVVLAAKTGEDDEDWFEITAGGSNDVQKKYELQKGGWRPYTITMKDGTKINYKDWPIAGILSGIGHIRDAKKYSFDDSTQMGLYATGFFQNFYDKSLLSGLQDFFGIFNVEAGRGKYAPDTKMSDRAKKYAAQQVRSVAVSNLSQQSGKMYSELVTGDPQRDAKTFAEVIYRDLPMFNDGIRPIIDVFGDDVKYNTTERLTPKFSVESDDMIKWLNENKLFVGVPQKKNIIVGDGSERPMTDEEYYEYRKLAGKETKTMINEFMEGIKYPDQDIKEKMFDAAKSTARKIAYITILEKYGLK